MEDAWTNSDLSVDVDDDVTADDADESMAAAVGDNARACNCGRAVYTPPRSHRSVGESTTSPLTP